MKILVTGATGFIGSALIEKLSMEHQNVRATILSMKSAEGLPDNIKRVLVEPFSDTVDLSGVLVGVDVVVHLAARVHIMKDEAADPLAEYRKINVGGTRRLVMQAAAAGVKRIVFLSSVKVHGEGKVSSYREDDPLSPLDGYSLSKCEAEEILWEFSRQTGIEVVIIRPPLVYGPNVSANFLQLLKLVNSGFPLPLASVANVRSFIGLNNLLDAISVCMVHPKAPGNTYFASDANDVSTPQLIRLMAKALGKTPRLFSFPVWLMRLCGKPIGMHKVVDRLVGSLTVDISKIETDLDWHPPYTMDQELNSTADWFHKRRQSLKS